MPTTAHIDLNVQAPYSIDTEGQPAGNTYGIEKA